MSNDDADPPVHRISRVEDRERLLAAALAEAETRDEQYRTPFSEGPPKGRWKTPTALAVFAVAGVVAFFPQPWIAPVPLPAPTDAELERGLRAALVLQAKQIEVFRAREGRLPDDLAEVPVRMEGLRFIRSNSRVYQIVGQRPDGSTLVYDSARPSPGVDRALASWFGMDTP